MKERVKIAVMVIIALAMVSNATGQIIFVDADSAGANDGSSWADAYNYLQDALAVAQYVDEIRVAQGVYTPAGPIAPVPPGQATNPKPADGAIDCSRYLILNWSAGYGATSHDVYFGTNSPSPFVQSQVLTVFYANNLDSNTTYYWRIDEVNWWGTTTGVVWSFTTVGNPTPPPPPPPPPMNLSNGQTEEVTFLERTATFQLKNGVVIKGGYAGFGQPNPDDRDITVYETILSGDLAGNDVDANNLSDLWDEPSRADNSLRVVTGSGTDATTVLDGFTIIGGNANQLGPPPPPPPESSPPVPNYYPPSHIGPGGGMFNHSGSPTVANCKFILNTANNRGGGMCNEEESNPTLSNCIFSENSASRGGAIYTEESNPSLVECTFNGNLASGYGGGMCNFKSEPTLTNCTFIGNSAGNKGENNGGGIYSYSSSTNITNCTFIGNSALAEGGAVYIHGISTSTLNNCIFIHNSAKYSGGAMVINHCNPTLINCTFRNNKTEWHKFGGGGILCDNEASPTLINCEFISNITQGDGGGMRNKISSSPTLLNCAFSGNWAGINGGGISSLTSSPILLNCAFSGNSAGINGGGIRSFKSSPTLVNCTFSGNWSGSYGGGIYSKGSDITLSNCVFCGDAAIEVSEIYLARFIDERGREYPSTINVEYTDICGWETNIYVGTDCTLYWGEGNIDADPYFTDIGYWGDRDDPNIVFEPNDPNAIWIDGDYHLLGGSPCIDAGDPCYVPEPNETDLDGMSRVIRGRIDMGAYEFYAPRNWNVDDDGPADFNNIQAAIETAYEGDTIVISPGTYTGEGNRDIDFLGKAITVRSVEPTDPNTVAATIIDCDGTLEDPHRGFYFHSGEDGDSVLSGLTITNGYADYGGGIFCLRSHPTITNCTIFNNTAKYWWDPWEQFSALLPNENSSPKVNNDGEVHINIPPPLPGWKGYGGGICCQLSSPTLTDCKFIGNSAYEYGGGMFSYNDSSPNLINCTFISNTATAGGAIRHSSGNLRLYNCIFNSNSAGWGGGAIMNYNSDTWFFNCIFTGNSTGGEGGVILNYHCHPMLINCTFSGNSAGSGGVIFNTGSDATLSNCILLDNTATKGNEIYLDFYTDFLGSEIPSTINVDYSDVDGGAAGVYVDAGCTLNWGEGNIDADPCFVSPGFWGSNGVWIDGDYHLLAESPCINAGDPNYVAEPNETDLDGKPRVIGGRIDMGAYEYRLPIPAEVRIVPRTINLQSKGELITGFIQMPEDYDMNDIDANSVYLEGEIKPEQFWLAEYNQIAIARFGREEVQAFLTVGEVELTITGQLKDGTPFEGTDVIRVIGKGRRKI